MLPLPRDMLDRGHPNLIEGDESLSLANIDF